jgi:putative transposase
VNHKRVWRLYKLNELSVRKRRKAKRVNLERTPLTASCLRISAIVDAGFSVIADGVSA